jgi:hypothetical protein
MEKEAEYYEWVALIAALCILACAIALLTLTVTDFITPVIDKTSPLYHWWQDIISN